MIKAVFSNTLWELIQQTDTVSKVVLGILLILSIICWTLFFYKLILMRLKRKHLELVIKLIKQAKNLEEVSAIASGYAGTIPGYFLSQNLFILKEYLEQHKTATLERIQQGIQGVVEDLLDKQESFLSFFSTTAAVSPLLGLLGTVWGLIQAFIGISEQQSADIAAVAPGIAEALITTFAGLLVAIPALIMYNYLAAQTSRLEAKLWALGDSYNRLVERFLTQ